MFLEYDKGGSHRRELVTFHLYSQIISIFSPLKSKLLLFVHNYTTTLTLSHHYPHLDGVVCFDADAPYLWTYTTTW